MSTPLWASADVFQKMTWTAELEILKNGYVSQVPYTTKIWIETSEGGSGSVHVTCTVTDGVVPAQLDTDGLELLLVLKANDVETGRELLDWRAQVTEEAHERGVFDVYRHDARMNMDTDGDPFFAYVNYNRFPRVFKGLHATIPALGVVQTQHWQRLVSVR